MALTPPVVSVVMASYNHAPFIREAITSVLAQDVDLELLVADDGSTDPTADIARSIQDPRLQVTAHAQNRGACVVTNELISRSRGQYIAIMNSDDVWKPAKLQTQLAVLAEHPECIASFGAAEFIDRAGKLIPRESQSSHYRDIFNKKNRSRGQWLRFFFEHGNCLCHPTLLIRSQAYQDIGLYDNRYRQFPDFDLWIRLLKHHEIHVSPEFFISFRLLPGENASSMTPKNLVRMENELYTLASKFFDHIPDDCLRDVFADLMRHPGLTTPQHKTIETALLLLSPHSTSRPIFSLAGLMALFQLLGDAALEDLLQTEYGLTARDLHDKMAEIDTLRRPDLNALSRSSGYDVLRELTKRIRARLRPG